MQGVYDYLTNITDQDAENDLVFMMDALDAWLQVSPKTLIERFDELHTSGVVIGADKVCWPNDWESVSLRYKCSFVLIVEFFSLSFRGSLHVKESQSQFFLKVFTRRMRNRVGQIAARY